MCIIIILCVDVRAFLSELAAFLVNTAIIYIIIGCICFWSFRAYVQPNGTRRKRVNHIPNESCLRFKNELGDVDVTKLEDELQIFVLYRWWPNWWFCSSVLRLRPYVYKLGLPEIYPNRFTSTFHYAGQRCLWRKQVHQAEAYRDKTSEVYHDGQTITLLSMIAIERHIALTYLIILQSFMSSRYRKLDAKV